MKQLYPFQQALVDRVRVHWRAGVQIVGLWSATGTGKTEMAMALSRAVLVRGGCILFIVDRVDLVEQNVSRWEAEGFEVGAVCGSMQRWDWDRDVVIASWQTLAGEWEALREWADRHASCAVVVDEAHEVAWASTVRDLLKGQWCSVQWRAVLLTATPWRVSKFEGMLDLVHEVVEGPTPAWAVAHGYLTRDEPLALPWQGVDLPAEKAVALTEEAEESIGITPVAIAGVVWALVEHGAGRRTLGYAISVRHAEALSEACGRAGLTSVVVSAKTPAAERQEAWRKLASGEAIVWNVGIAVKGLDVRSIDRVAVCRVIGSRAWWFQAIGRGMRRLEGKQDCTVLDFGGNVARFGPSCALDSWGAVKGQTPDEAAAEKAMAELAAMVVEAMEGKSVKVWVSTCGRKWPTKVRTCPDCGEAKPPKLEPIQVGWPHDGAFSRQGVRVRGIQAVVVFVGDAQLSPFNGEIRRQVIMRARHPLEGGWYSLSGWIEASKAPPRRSQVLLDGTVTGSGGARVTTYLNRVALEVCDER